MEEAGTVDAGTEREQPRYEIKYLFRCDAYETLLFLIRSQGPGFFRPFPSRIVQSIYLDTENCRSAAENIAGQSGRRKLRFRWYGGDSSAAAGALELKRRDNFLVVKERARVDGPVLLRGQTRPALSRALRAAAPPAFRAHIDEGLEPSQWIRYEREYFATRDGHVRVTVDRRIQSWDLRDAYVISDRAPTPLAENVVVECKALPEHHDELQDVAATLPGSKTRCSKYVMACLPGHYYV